MAAVAPAADRILPPRGSGSLALLSRTVLDVVLVGPLRS